MASTLIFWLFLVFLIGGTMAFLMFGYSSIERRRADEEELRRVKSLEAATTVPRFFHVADASKPVPHGSVTDAMLADLESYLQREQDAVARFVRAPSLERLYGGNGSETHIH